MSSGFRTAEQAKAEHVARMGSELGECYSALWQELAWMHRKWAEYQALFGTSPERISVLNQAAPRFFRTVQDALWEDILLHLARMTDSPRSVGRENLSVRRLPNLDRLRGESELNALVAAAVKSTDFARDWRNRKLAHRDLALALGRQVDPLSPASRQLVRDALAGQVAILNWIGLKFLDSTTMFESDSADAVSLLYVVRDGLRYDEERRERIRQGSRRPIDLHPDPL